MFRVALLQHLPPAEYDRLMAAGWFRSGSVLFHADVLAVDDRIRGLVHIRLPLEGDEPGRGRRRSLRRNRARFRVEIGPARVDAARQRLYDLTKARFMSFVLKELRTLVEGEYVGVFDTRECAVYDGDRLVAVSFFDVGETGVAGQLGLHDPEYARFGLGKFTMFEEIEWAKAQGYQHYYPGYLVPGQQRFDYKLSIGEVQYLETTRWRRRAAPPALVPAAKRYAARLDALADALARAGLVASRRLYAGFWLAAIPELAAADFVGAMAHLQIVDPRDPERILIAEYREADDAFALLEAEIEPEIDLTEGYEPLGPESKAYELRALRTRAEWGDTRSAKALAALAADCLAR